ncbi:ANKRD50 [Symbiodinium natans]|uniref:ANKRD50 protein n=1 Tax=Symbiodinium natans TaxID=878477 RepID=A0A812N736_9DINO|nr:ANKRD50 [Symbiodinium natans]
MLNIMLLSGQHLTSLPLAELSDVKALKQRLHQEHGLPPRFRQRLLQDGHPLDDAVKLLARLETDETAMDLQILIVAFSEVSEEQRQELNNAAWFGNAAKVEALLQLPMDPDPDAARDAGGRTPLMRASQGGTAKVAQLLLEAGAQKDVHDIEGRTALMYAAWSGHSEVVELLLHAGAQTDLCDLKGRTALITAAWLGRESVVRLLLEAGADTDLCDSSGQTALILAATHGRTPVVRLLVDAGAT